MGCDIVTVSTDTQFSHLAWQRSEKELANVKYQMGADPTGKISRMFGVYDENTGLDLRGTFIINPEGKLLNMEMNFYNLGRNIDEMMRKFKANIYMGKKTNEVCPSKWKDEGDKTLVNPGARMVGKVHEALLLGLRRALPPFERGGARPGRGAAYARGFTHVSDHARQALEPCRSPRISGHTLPVATLPLISSWADRAGKKVLNTPMGRLLKPGGAWSTKGSMQSYQDMVIRASEAATVSVAAERGPPARANSADITGSAVSAKAG